MANLTVIKKAYFVQILLIKTAILSTLMILIIGCRPNSSGSISPTAPRFDFSAPISPMPSRPNYGKASVMGRVITYSGRPLIGMPVRLAKVYDQGKEKIFVLEGGFSPVGVTQDDGYFMIENIEPGEYVMVVGNPESIYEIISESPGKAKVWNFVANEVTNVGVIRVRLQP